MPAASAVGARRWRGAQVLVRESDLAPTSRDRATTRFHEHSNSIDRKAFMPSSLNARSPSLFRVAGVLALLFVVSGGPSAGLAMLAGFDRWAMLSGALGAYNVLLLASQLPWFRGLVRDPAIASAIGVVLRLRLITLPIGVGIDCIFGIASMWLAG